MRADLEPLRLSFDVDCSPAHAFHVWTADIAAWWPADHSVSGQPGIVVVIEPAVGGRIYERTPAGDEHEWGEVTAWQPPGRLSYLWHLRRDRADATDVDISFTATSDGATRVEVRHAGWERLGADASLWRERNTGGWNSLLPHFAAAAEDREVTR